MWSNDGTNTSCPGCGHVAVVEAVNSDNTIDFSEANISGIKTSANPYGWQYVKSLPIDSVKKRWSGYSFVGYIYTVE